MGFSKAHLPANLEVANSIVLNGQKAYAITGNQKLISYRGQQSVYVSSIDVIVNCV